MVNDETINKEKLPASRSPRFPSIILPYAISVVAEAYKFGKKITDSHIAGDHSTKGGTYARKKASLKYYGLIEVDGNKITITNLAEKIINPLDEKEKSGAIKEAFLKPELFNKLYSNTNKNTPIKLSFLSAILLREHGIQPAAKNEFLSTFIKSGIFANLIRYNNEDKSEILLLDVTKEVKELDQAENPFFDFFQNKNPEKPVATQTVELKLSNGQAKITVPSELTPEDVKKLKAQINVLANVYEEG